MKNLQNQTILTNAPEILWNTELPASTSSYKAVHHLSVLDFVESNLLKAGYSVQSSNISTDATGNKMVGTVRIDKGNDMFGMTMGFRNSYDKSMSLALGIGAEVFVCSNGMFLADVTQLRKHTINISRDVQGIMDTQILQMDRLFEKFAEDAEVLENTPITESAVQEIVGRMFLTEKIITTAQINIIRTELYKSENFAMFGPEGSMNHWNMLNNVTEALKKSHSTNYFRDHSTAYNLILDHAR